LTKIFPVDKVPPLMNKRVMGILAVRPAGLIWLLGIVAACAGVFLAAGRIFSAFASPPQSVRAPQIETDQLEYLAGEAINISGEQFDAFERVTVRVAHPGTTFNGRGGLASFSVTADDNGRFQARWSIDRHDAGGNHFIVTAEGTSGSRADAAFDRAGILAAEQPLDLAAGHLRLRAEGFNQNELVTLQVGDGHDVVTLTLVSDERGALSAPLDLPGANPDAAMFIVVATGDQSGLKLSLALTEYAIAAPRPNGIPTLDALRSEKGLAQAGWMEKAASYDLFMSWNATAWAGRTGNACALFDTGDQEDLVGLAVCGQIANRDGDPRLVVQTAASPSVFTCDNRWNDRCGNPIPYGSSLQVGAGVRSGTLTDLSRNGNLITPDEANDGRTTRSTLRIQVDKNFLPGKTSLMGVCAYMNPAGAGADGPLNCVRVAGAGKSHGGPGSGGGGGGGGDGGGGGVSGDVPALAGRVVYHSYVSYNDGSSRLFILHLSTGQLNAISSGWTNLVDPMNAHWSPDGTKIVFMARPKKGKRASAWFDVFLYAVGQPGNPVNLTNTVSRHEEDPKFSPDGQTIVYKTRPSTIAEMDGGGALLNTIIASDGAERSMPYYTADGAAVWFSNRPSSASISASSIHIVPVNGAPDALVVDTPDVIDYYPIRDTIGQFLYSRTVSASNLFGQVYMYDGVQSVSLAFNTADADYSDAYPIDPRYIILSSTKSAGHGGYDLYIADRNTGTLWSLDGYNTGVNTNREELGAAYMPN
jgi:WD40-like Beta Propeller Repeat